jgi:transcriptional regulator with XRE-family HTH domain
VINLLLSEFIQKRRQELGITRKELADAAEVSVSVVKRFEASKPYNPQGNNLFKVAKALEVSVDDLLFNCVWP